MLGSRTELHIFKGSSVTGAHYFTNVLHFHVRLLEVLWILSSSSWMTKLHRTATDTELLDIDEIQRMDGPARFLNLNQFEHVWYTL